MRQPAEGETDAQTEQERGQKSTARQAISFGKGKVRLGKVVSRAFLQPGRGGWAIHPCPDLVGRDPRPERNQEVPKNTTVADTA